MADKTFTYGPDNVDQLLTSTLSKWLEGGNLEDQIFSKKPLLKKMFAKAKMLDGGASILQNVMYGANGTAQSYSGYDILDVTPQDGFTTTQALWKNIAVSIAIAQDQIDKNTGEAAIINLLQSKTDQAVESLRDELSTQLFAAAIGSKDITSLPVIMDATSTIQDVNSTSNSWWQATVATSGSFATRGLDDMRTNSDTVDEYNPDSVLDTYVTTKAVKNYYEASLTPNVRYTPAGTGNPTFSSLMFRDAEVFSDPKCTSGTMFAFSTEDLFFVINSNANMKKSEFVKPSNQMAKVAQVILMLELVTRARRKLLKIGSITA